VKRMGEFLSLAVRADIDTVALVFTRAEGTTETFYLDPTTATTFASRIRLAAKKIERTPIETFDVVPKRIVKQSRK
jgi:hypothetical protein